MSSNKQMVIAELTTYSFSLKDIVTESKSDLLDCLIQLRGCLGEIFFIGIKPSLYLTPL